MTTTSTDPVTPSSFTSMDVSTAEQWAVIGVETAQNQPRVADRVLAMLESLAEVVDGFAVDQLTHSLQTATRAERAGADDERRGALQRGLFVAPDDALPLRHERDHRAPVGLLLVERRPRPRQRLRHIGRDSPTHLRRLRRSFRLQHNGLSNFRDHRQRPVTLIGRDKQRLLIFLHVPVVSHWRALHRHIQRIRCAR